MRNIYNMLCIAQQRWGKTLRIMKLSAGLILFAMLPALAVNTDSNSIGSETTEQQGRRITGQVTDQTGASLPGVSVIVKGTTTGVITDNNGNYSLELPENAATLTFSFVGMRQQDVAIDTKSVIMWFFRKKLLV